MSLRPAGLEAHLFPSRACSDATPDYALASGPLPTPPCHNHAVADFGESARTSHISKMVLSIVKFGGPNKTELRNSRWEVLI